MTFDMSQMTDTSATDSRRQARRLKIAGLIILLAGIIAAGLVYWIGSRAEDLNDNPAMLGFNRAEERQMGQLYGKSGQMMDEWLDDLQQPGTQAGIIVAVSVGAAWICLFVSRRCD